ncbi:putative solute-binding protein [Perlucidibaca piscinae]|uniref:putative solute-binding protein n=1 Tax=Perlucidibaca piscinae TaxID=392589 RepID=UPI0003B332A1|nr:putative solute-binding protein [Perlucidibaca piscinae]
MSRFLSLPALLALVLLPVFSLPAQAVMPQPDAAQRKALESMKGKNVRFCIFDPVGANGPAMGYAKDYLLEGRKWGINAELRAYVDERVAAEDLKAGLCDAAAITTLRTKQFNHFVGSLDAVGGVPDNAHMRDVLRSLADPKMAPLMIKGNFEVAGLIPLGSVYVMVRDRAINSIEKAAGKKVAVMEWDKSQAKMVQRLGAQPVASDITNFAGKFNNGQVDIIAAPAVAFKPLEIYRGLGDKGAVYRFPLAMLSASIVLRRDRFPPEVGQKMREFVVTQIEEAYKYIAREEAGIEARYWLDLTPADKAKYLGLMREARLSMTAEGDYDPRMMKLLKRVRCKNAPGSAECSLNDE